MAYNPRKMQKGSAAITISAGGTTTATVTFPTPFASTPIVVATLLWGTGLSNIYWVDWTIKSITATTFIFQAATSGGTWGNGTVQWIAWL